VSYRNDDDALRAYHDDLVRDLAALESQLAPLEELAARRSHLLDELARIRADLDARAARNAPVRLDQIRVAAPCRERWDVMTGDDRARHCARCDKMVFNLSAMTTADAEELLAEHGTQLCVRFFRRADGTIKTADCPPGGRRRVALAVAAGAVAMVAGVSAAAVAFTGGAAEKVTDERVGKMEVSPVPPAPPETMGAIAIDPQPPADPASTEIKATMGEVVVP